MECENKQTIWSPKEIDCFLNLLSERMIVKVLGATTSTIDMAKLLMFLAEEMKRHGYPRSTHEIYKKYVSLRNNYYRTRMFLDTNCNNHEMRYQILQKCVWFNHLHNIFKYRQLQIDDFLEEEDYNIPQLDKEIPANPVYLPDSNGQKRRPIRPVPIVQTSIPTQQPIIQQNNNNNQNKTTKIQHNYENNNDIIIKQNSQNSLSGGRQVQVQDGNNFETIQLQIQHLKSVLNYQRSVVMNAKMVTQEYSAMITETVMLLQRYENKVRSIKCPDYQQQYQGHDVTPPLSPIEQKSIINGTSKLSAEQSPPSAHQQKFSCKSVDCCPQPVSTIVSPILQTPPAHQNSSDLSLKFKFDQATPETLLSPTAGAPGYKLPGVIQRPQFSPNNIPKSSSFTKPLKSSSPKRSSPPSSSSLLKKFFVSQNEKPSVTYCSDESERNLRVS